MKLCKWLSMLYTRDHGCREVHRNYKYVMPITMVVIWPLSSSLEKEKKMDYPSLLAHSSYLGLATCQGNVIQNEM